MRSAPCPLAPAINRREPGTGRRPAFAASRPPRGLTLIAGCVTAGLMSLAPALAPLAAAQGRADADDSRSRYDIPGGSLDQVLNGYASQAGVLISIDGSLTANRNSPGLSGSYTVAGGFSELLRVHGLQARREADGGYILQRAPVPTDGPSSSIGQPGSDGTVLPTVTVRGDTRLSGVPPPAYAGGAVSRRSRVGMMGDLDYMETPFSTITYTEAAIENRNSDNILDVITDTDASVRKQGNGFGLYNDGINLRGFPSYGQEFGINLLFGIAPFSNNYASTIAERIEVLKGPSALLNGILPLGSVGGAVNVVTKRAGSTPLTRLSAGYTSDALWQVHADVGRRFGSEQQFGVRINGARTQGDTAIDHQKVRNSTLGLGLDFRGERLRLSADLLSFDARIDGIDAGLLLGPTLTSVPRAPRAGSLVSGEPWTFRDTTDRLLLARAELDISDSLMAWLNVGLRNSEYKFVATQWQVNDLAGDSTLARWRYSPQENRARAIDLGVTARASTGPIGHRLSVNAAVFDQDSYLSASGHSIYTPLAGSRNIYSPVYLPAPLIPAATDVFRQSSKRHTSIGIADTLSFLDDRILVTLGLRRQAVDQYGYDISSGARTPAYESSATTGSAAFVVRASEQIAVYGNYIEGLSPGATAPAEASNSGEVFAPYRTRQVETGVKMDWGRFSTTISAFQIEQPSAYTDPRTLHFSASGEQRNRGIELSFFGEPRAGLRLLGGLAWIQGRLTRTAGGVNQGNTAAAVPEWALKLGAEYDLPWLPGLTLVGNGIHTGKQYVDQANTLSIPSWSRFDIGARYATQVGGRPLTLRANVFNLFDRTYWISGNLWNGVSDPRTFVLSASVDF